MIDNLHLLELDGEELKQLIQAARLPMTQYKLKYTIQAVDPVTVVVLAIQQQTAMLTPPETIQDVTLGVFIPYVKGRRIFVTPLPYNKQITTLTEPEQKLVALALFGYVMRAGPEQFEAVITIANKIGITDKLEAYGKDWIDTAKSTAVDFAALKNNESKATIQFAIFHGITTQWHLKDSQLFAKALTEGVYKELFESIIYKEDIIKVLNQTTNP